MLQQKAIEELKDNNDGDLKNLFSQMVSESQQYKSELSQMVTSYGGEVVESSTISGKIYRFWMDVKHFSQAKMQHKKPIKWL